MNHLKHFGQVAILVLLSAAAQAQKINLPTQTRGVLPVANGGTGASTATVVNVSSIAGVDCTGATDSSTALNTLWDTRLGGNINGKHIIIPPGCQIRADNPLIVFGQSYFVIDGGGREPIMDNGSAIFGCNGVAGAVLTISRSGHAKISGPSINAKGLSCSSSFTGSVLVESDTSGGVTATDIWFESVDINTNRGGTQIANYIGIQVGINNGSQNTEKIKISDSHIQCGSNSTGSMGLEFKSGNSDHTEVVHNDITNCYFGIHGRMGGTIQDNNLSNGSFAVFGAGGATIHATACAAQQLLIIGNELAEDSGQFFQNEVGGGCPNVTIINTAQNTTAVDPSVFNIDVGNGITSLVLLGNNFNMRSTTSLPIVGTSVSATVMNSTNITERGNVVTNATGGLLQNVRIPQGTCCGDIYKIVKTGQVAAITASDLAGRTAVTTYRLSAQVTCTAASAAATVTVTFSWTDTSNTAQTATVPTATCTTLGASSIADLTKVVRVKAGTNVQYAAAIANTPTYDVTVTAETLSSN